MDSDNSLTLAQKAIAEDPRLCAPKFLRKLHELVHVHHFTLPYVTKSNRIRHTSNTLNGPRTEKPYL